MYKNIIKSSDLNYSNRCLKSRNFPFVLKSDSSIVKKIFAEKSALLNAMFSDTRQAYLKERNEVKKENLLKQLAAEITEDLVSEYDYYGYEFDLKLQKEANAKMMSAVIIRYVISELRTPLTPDKIKAMVLNFAELDSYIKVVPDMVFYYKDSKNIDTVEAVIIKTGKANNFTKTGKKKDSSIMKSLELYALFNYARALAKSGTHTNIRASYYYLKSKDDFKQGNGLSESDFFKANSTVFTLEDSVDKTPDGKFSYSVIDMDFKNQLREFNNGQDEKECTPDDCKYCDLKEFCQYQTAPESIKTTKKSATAQPIALSEDQLDIINFREGYGVVNAGAGAGKTLVVGYNIETYLEEGGKEEDCLLITFTDNGAAEMRSRIALYLEDNGMSEVDMSKIHIQTFNSFGNDILKMKEVYGLLGFTAPPKIIEDTDRAEIISEIADKWNFAGINYALFKTEMTSKAYADGLETITTAFNLIKDNNLSAGDEDTLRSLLPMRCWIAMAASEKCLTQLLEAYIEYDNALRVSNLIEYSDQELLILELLAQKPYFFDDNFKFKHIIVDEFQDSSERQIEILKKLIDTIHFKCILVVGDDSQAIYSFRGTSPKHLINFFNEIGAPEDERHVFNLVENYRCSPEIITAANRINELNKNRVDKQLIPHKKSHNKPVTVKGFYDSDEELDFIVNDIKLKIDSGTAPEQIAVLGKDRYFLAKIAERFVDIGIPYVSMYPEYVLENSKVKAAMAVAKAINDPTLTKEILVYLNALSDNTLLNEDTECIQNEADLMSRKLQAINELKDSEKQEEYISLIEDLNVSIPDEILEFFIETIKRRQVFSQTLKYISKMELYGKNQKKKRERDYPGVFLSTMHSAKGLEWNTVYMSLDKLDMDCYQISPSQHVDAIDETRRLIFVSMTRAKEKLICTGLFEYKKGMYNEFLKEVYDVLDKTDAYEKLKNDPNAENKKALKKAENEEAKRQAAAYKAKCMSEAEKSSLVSPDEYIISAELEPETYPTDANTDAYKIA